MSNEELPEKYDPKTLLGKALVDFDKIGLPEMIEKNLIRSACRLITGVVDIPVAWLKSIERNISRETEALDLISKSNSEDIAQLNSQDYEFIQSTANYYSLKQFKETSNRRKVLNLAISELKHTPAGDTADSIDEDWLNRFSKITENTSAEEVQILFAKVLAGEIKRPGSFSTVTLNTLSMLDKATARDFMWFSSFCVRMHGHSEPHIFTPIIKNPKNLSKPNFSIPSYDAFISLIDLGLLRLRAVSKSFSQSDFSEEVLIGKSRLKFHTLISLPLSRDSMVCQCMSLTTAGLEIFDVIEPLEAAKGYRSVFIEWVHHHFDLDLDYSHD